MKIWQKQVLFSFFSFLIFFDKTPHNYFCTSREGMEQHVLKNVNSCWNTKNTFNLVTSGGQNSNLYLNAVYVFNTSVDWISVAA